MRTTYVISGMVSGLVLALLTGATTTASIASVGASHAGVSTAPPRITDGNYRYARRGRRGSGHDESHDDDNDRGHHNDNRNDSHRKHEPGHHTSGQPGSSSNTPSSKSDAPSRPGSSFRPMLQIEVPPSANQLKQPSQATPGKAGPALQQPDKQPVTATQPQPRDEPAPQQANPAPQPPAEAKDTSTTK